MARLPHVWPHPSSAVLSRYLDGDLPVDERDDVEWHLCDCRGCRRTLASLSSTVEALHTMRSKPSERSPRAESIIAALRATSPNATEPGSRGRRFDFAARLRSWVAFRVALPRLPRLRYTVPVALVLGLALSFVNQGGMLLAGRIDVRMCVACSLNFVLPFVAMNVALLGAARIRWRRR
jgi:anti-sigma factor RsiW